jgi:heme exporter protein A
MRLIVDRLSLERGGRSIQSDVSLTVTAGEACVLVGPNGAGKTSLLRAIAGLLRPAAGTVRLEGGDPEASVGEQCHWVGHLNATKPELTVGQNLAFWSAYLGDGHPDRDVAALERLGIAGLADAPAAWLSAGQQRRLCLARLLVADRPLWLLDEPTTAIDTAGQNMFAEIVADHLDGGGILVAATHHDLRLGARARTLELEG